jgi:hypothetical protein
MLAIVDADALARMVMLMPNVSPLHWVLGLIWISAIGCGEVAIDATHANIEGMAKGDTAYDAESAEAVPDVRGSYHLRLDSILMTQTDGVIASHHFEMHALAVIDQTNAWVTLYLAPCEILLPKMGGEQPLLPKEAIHAMDSVAFEGSLIPTPGEVRLDLGAGALQLGAALKDPLLDPLPVGAHAPELLDSDLDGLPGVSLKVGSFKVYMALRSVLSFDGAVLTDGSFMGDATVTTDLEIYGDNIPFVNIAKKLQAAGEETEVIDEIHAFTMVRLPNDPLSCEALNAPSPALGDSPDLSEDSTLDEPEEEPHFDDFSESDDGSEGGSGNDEDDYDSEFDLE